MKLLAAPLLPRLVPSQNKHCAGRPRVREDDLEWQSFPGTGSHQGAGLPNFSSVCYRNGVLQLLLNNSVFVKWLMRHKSDVCLTHDCITCKFQAFSSEYHRLPNDYRSLEFRLRLFEFWDCCEKVFWGPRARRKRKINDGQGGSPAQLLHFLIAELFEQLQNVPSELQSLERIFYRQQSGGVTCNLCKWKSPISYEEGFSFALNLDILTHGNIERDLRRYLNGGHSFYGSGGVCEDCGVRGKDLHAQRIITNPPDILIITIARISNGEFQEPADFEHYLDILPELSIPSKTEPMPVTYTLSGITMGPPLAKKGIGHALSVVRTRDGKLHWIDDKKITEAFSWRCVEEWQRIDYPPEERQLPFIFMYTRKSTGKRKKSTSPDLSSIRRSPSSNRKSKSPKASSAGSAGIQDLLGDIELHDNPETEPIVPHNTVAEKTGVGVKSPSSAIVRDISAAFPSVDKEIILGALRSNGDNIQKTVDYLLGKTSTDTWSDKHLSVKYRADLLKLYVQFPWIKMSTISDTLHLQGMDVEKTKEVLESGPKINLGLTQKVGIAEFTTRMDIMPSEATGMVKTEFEEQHIVGKCRYEMDGVVWEGKIKGWAKRLA